MPRVKQVVAAKDYPDFGIEKGQKHYYWKLKTGPRSSRTFRQVEPPRMNQLTTSAYKIAIADIEEQRSKITSYEEMDDLINAVRELAEEQSEKYENMPEGLQQGDTGQTLYEQSETLNAVADELESVKDDWESAYGEWETAKQEYDEAMTQYNADQAEWDNLSEDEQAEADMPNEPEEVDDEFDAEEYIGRMNDESLEG